MNATHHYATVKTSKKKIRTHKTDESQQTAKSNCRTYTSYDSVF